MFYKKILYLCRPIDKKHYHAHQEKHNNPMPTDGRDKRHGVVAARLAVAEGGLRRGQQQDVGGCHRQGDARAHEQRTHHQLVRRTERTGGRCADTERRLPGGHAFGRTRARHHVAHRRQRPAGHHRRCAERRGHPLHHLSLPISLPSIRTLSRIQITNTSLCVSLPGYLLSCCG